MKAIKILCLVILVSIQATYAQTEKKDKDALKQAEFKKMIESRSYLFLAQSATPLRGGNIQLTYGYDLLLNKDSLVVYLPYFGRAYVAPIDPMNNGLDFTSTKFSYNSIAKKNGYEISIMPTDTKDVRQIFLDVSTSGYGTLRINSLNRDAITFNGYLEAPKKAKSK